VRNNAPTAEANQPMSADAARWVLVASILGSAMAFLDGTVVNVALPKLQTVFHATGSQLQWIVEAFALTLAALILVGGSIGDRYGRKRVYLIGVASFAAASVWCGATTTIHGLIFARAVQGIGAAMLIPGSLSLITAAFPEEQRGKAIGTWSGVTAITSAAGPVLGGWLIQHASWRWVFLINLPIALAVLVISWKGYPETKLHDSQGLDWAGALLASGGLGATTYALMQISSDGAYVLWIGGAGLIMLGLFGWVEARSPKAMAPLDLFRSRNFLGANLMTLFLYGALSGLLYYLPLNLMQVQHYAPTAAGAVLLPVVLLIFLLSRWSGGLVDRYGSAMPLIVGPAIVGLGFAMLALPGLGGSYWKTFFLPSMVLGFGMAVSVAPLTTVVMNSVEEARAGAASGVNNAVSRATSLLALAVFGVILHTSFQTALDRGLNHANISPQVRQQVEAQRSSLAGINTPDPAAQRVVLEAFVAGFRRVMLTASGLCLLAAVSAGLFVRTSAAKAKEQQA
jgi:EmrB/QacA subfamily drug resistance transporter